MLPRIRARIAILAALAVPTGHVVGQNALPIPLLVPPIPLLVQEALPPDPRQPDFQLLPGVARANEAVTFGLPLPASSGISSTASLGLSGASCAQFRVLDRWPNGVIRWVLVDTQVTLPAGGQNTGLALSAGSGSFGGPDLAMDLGTTISVSTGPAVFTVRKQGFNLVDGVVVNGVTLVTAGTSPGIELAGDDGTLFTAANDPNVDVAIEENGPVRAVIRARGTHRSAAGVRNLDFTARLHFYKDRSQVKVFYTLRNASKQQVLNVPIRSLELVLTTTLSSPAFRIANHTGETTGTLGAGETVHLFQGENAYPNFRDYDFTDFDSGGNVITTRWPTTIAGYTIVKGAQTLASGDRTQFIDPSYAQASGAGGAVTFGTRFAAGWWPQGLSIDGGGTIRAGLFPPGNDRRYVIRFAGHVTREVLFDFESTSIAPHDPFFRFQYPLAGKAADVEVYNRSGALWEKLVSLDDEAAYEDGHGWPSNETRDRRPEFLVYRHFYWGNGGGQNQYDRVKTGLFNFWRDRAPFSGGYQANAEQRIAYNADLSVYHSDDFDSSQAYDQVPELRDGFGNLLTFSQLPNGSLVPSAKAIFEGEHRHATSLALWYFASGDERLKEAYTDWGEWMHSSNTINFNSYERALAWNVFNLVDLYRFTGDVAHRDLAWQFLRDEVLNRTAVHLQSPGTDWQRGFYEDDSDAMSADRSLAAFIKGAIIPRAYAYFLDYGAADESQADRVRDVLEGMVRFASNELWFEYSQSPGDFGFPYRISADSAPPADVRQMSDWYGGMREAYLTFFYGYLLTGDAEFLRRGELLQKATAYDPGSAGTGNWFQDLPDRQVLQRLLQHPEEFAVWRDLPLAVQDEGGGAYSLSWTVPAGATALWIKTAGRPIVPWLGFDRATRQFQYQPASYVPFFAATNLAGEPAPGSAGSLQTWAVSGLGSGASFAARVLVNGTNCPTDPLSPAVTAPAAITLAQTTCN